MGAEPDDRTGWGLVPAGLGYTFGADITQAVLKANGLDFLVRSHQFVYGGYQWTHENGVVTICSTPGFLNRFKNEAAVLKIDENMHHEFQQIRASPWPVK